MNNNTLDGWITVKHGEPVKAVVVVVVASQTFGP